MGETWSDVASNCCNSYKRVSGTGKWEMGRWSSYPLLTTNKGGEAPKGATCQRSETLGYCDGKFPPPSGPGATS